MQTKKEPCCHHAVKLSVRSRNQASGAISLAKTPATVDRNAGCALLHSRHAWRIEFRRKTGREDPPTLVWMRPPLRGKGSASSTSNPTSRHLGT